MAAEPPTLAGSPTGPSTATAPGELNSHGARQGIRAVIVEELVRGATEARTKSLAAAGKVLNDYERAELRREEDQLDERAAAELNQIKRQRARMRSGVVREDEAPELPLAGSPRPH